ncbi:MAG: lysylphosphatidylglycerol synthase domain-containing protein [Rhodospirillales bacterium]
MRGVLILALVIGLGSFSAVVAWVGAGDILKAVAAAGAGVFVVAGFHLLPLSLDALSWRALCRGEHLSALQAVRFRWIGQSVNGLLPAAQVGGDLLRIRLAKAAGMSGDLAAAGVVADLTLAVATQIVYSLMGLAALAFLGLDLGDGHGTALAGSLPARRSCAAGPRHSGVQLESASR